MTLGTHVAFTSVRYLGGATLFGYQPDGISWLLAAVASLLPDVDLPPQKSAGYSGSSRCRWNGASAIALARQAGLTGVARKRFRPRG